VVEHRSEKPGVDSSILSPATTFMMKRTLPVLAVAVFAVLGSAQDATGPVVKNTAQIDWKASGSLPPGAEYHLIYEDKLTHAVQILVRMPNGYALPKHAHTHDETILVLKGKLIVDIGGKTETLSPNGYAVIPAGTVFSFKAGGFGGVEFFAAFNGPYDLKGPAAASKP
jgi:quercetin dioxygenase-like cupin family protein